MAKEIYEQEPNILAGIHLLAEQLEEDYDERNGLLFIRYTPDPNSDNGVVGTVYSACSELAAASVLSELMHNNKDFDDLMIGVISHILIDRVPAEKFDEFIKFLETNVRTSNNNLN